MAENTDQNNGQALRALYSRYTRDEIGEVRLQAGDLSVLIKEIADARGYDLTLDEKPVATPPGFVEPNMSAAPEIDYNKLADALAARLPSVTAQPKEAIAHRDSKPSSTEQNPSTYPQPVHSPYLPNQNWLPESENKNSDNR